MEDDVIGSSGGVRPGVSKVLRLDVTVIGGVALRVRVDTRIEVEAGD
jgi:hypothetical protein